EAQPQRLDRARHLEGEVDAAAGRIADVLGAFGVASVERVGRAELAREPELLVGKIDRDDALRTGDARAEQATQADAAEPDHGDDVARAHAGGGERRAAPRLHPAT